MHDHGSAHGPLADLSIVLGFALNMETQLKDLGSRMPRSFRGACVGDPPHVPIAVADDRKNHL